MQEVLMARLHQYITDNHPDLLITLQHEGRVSGYLKERVTGIDPILNELLAADTPAFLLQEQCMDELIKQFTPSKFNYLISIFEKEFETDCQRLKQYGLLTYEIINLIEACRPVFETLGFSNESDNDQHLRYAVTGVIKEYLENKQ